MRYRDTVKGIFLDRPNRFIAHVRIDGKTETVHVKNTERCRELLLPGTEVWMAKSDNPARKTKYDLIAVRKASGMLVNIDSQAPNKVVREWLETQSFTEIVPEYNMEIPVLISIWRKARKSICWKSRAARWRLTARVISRTRRRSGM